MELHSYWEVPSIGQFFSLFKDHFKLIQFEIEELEEALLTSDEFGTSPLLVNLFVLLLKGCFPRKDVSAHNYEKYLKELLKQRWVAEDKLENPLEGEETRYGSLSLRHKVTILLAVCNYRLLANDVGDTLMEVEGENLRSEPVGHSADGSSFWYFYGTRLYMEQPCNEPPSYTITPNNTKSTVDSKTIKVENPDLTPSAPGIGCYSFSKKYKRLLHLKIVRRSRLWLRKIQAYHLKGKVIRKCKKGNINQKKIKTQKEDNNGKRKRNCGAIMRQKDLLTKRRQTHTPLKVFCNGNESTGSLENSQDLNDSQVRRSSRVPKKRNFDSPPRSVRSKGNLSSAPSPNSDGGHSRCSGNKTPSTPPVTDLEVIELKTARARKIVQQLFMPVSDEITSSDSRRSRGRPKSDRKEVKSTPSMDTDDSLLESFRRRSGRQRRPVEVYKDDTFEKRRTKDRGNNKNVVHNKSVEYDSDASSEKLKEEEDKSDDDEEMKELEKPKYYRWSLVCKTLDDWIKLTDRFKNAVEECEKDLYKILTENFLETIKAFFAEQEREKAKRERLRTSTRTELKRLNIGVNMLETFGEETSAKKSRRAEMDEANRLKQIELQKEQREKECQLQKERIKEERARRAEIRELRLAVLAENKDISPDQLESFLSNERSFLSESHTEAFLKVLQHVRACRHSWPFLKAVDEQFAPRYYEIITEPMDISTIEERLTSKKHYHSIDAVFEDFQLIVDNCNIYNGRDSDYSRMAHKLLTVFEKMTKKFKCSGDGGQSLQALRLSKISDGGMAAENSRPRFGRPVRAAQSRALSTIHMATRGIQASSDSEFEDGVVEDEDDKNSVSWHDHDYGNPTTQGTTSGETKGQNMPRAPKPDGVFNTRATAPAGTTTIGLISNTSTPDPLKFYNSRTVTFSIRLSNPPPTYATASQPVFSEGDVPMILSHLPPRLNLITTSLQPSQPVARPVFPLTNTAGLVKCSSSVISLPTVTFNQSSSPLLRGTLIQRQPEFGPYVPTAFHPPSTLPGSTAASQASQLITVLQQIRASTNQQSNARPTGQLISTRLSIPRAPLTPSIVHSSVTSTFVNRISSLISTGRPTSPASSIVLSSAPRTALMMSPPSNVRFIVSPQSLVKSSSPNIVLNPPKQFNIIRSPVANIATISSANVPVSSFRFAELSSITSGRPIVQPVRSPVDTLLHSLGVVQLQTPASIVKPAQPLSTMTPVLSTGVRSISVPSVSQQMIVIRTPTGLVIRTPAGLRMLPVSMLPAGSAGTKQSLESAVPNRLVTVTQGSLTNIPEQNARITAATETHLLDSALRVASNGPCVLMQEQCVAPVDTVQLNGFVGTTTEELKINTSTMST